MEIIKARWGYIHAPVSRRVVLPLGLSAFKELGNVNDKTFHFRRGGRRRSGRWADQPKHFLIFYPFSLSHSWLSILSSALPVMRRRAAELKKSVWRVLGRKTRTCITQMSTPLIPFTERLWLPSSGAARNHRCARRIQTRKCSSLCQDFTFYW